MWPDQGQRSTPEPASVHYRDLAITKLWLHPLFCSMLNLYSLSWVIPRHLNFMYRRFGTLFHHRSLKIRKWKQFYAKKGKVKNFIHPKKHLLKVISIHLHQNKTPNINFMVTPCISNIQHSNNQLVHTTLKNVELLKHFKTSKTAPTCFGLRGNHHQGATIST